MPDKITFARLQERVAGAADTSKKEAHSLLKGLVTAVGTGLVVDGKVNLPGLGRFSLKVQNARTGRNPRTGESIDIPEKNRTRFLPEASLRRYINRRYEQIPTVKPPQPKPSAETATIAVPQSAAAPDGPTGPEKSEEQPPLPPPEPQRNVQPPPPAPGGTPGQTPGPAPIRETAGGRKKPVAAAVILILLLVGVYFLWPQPPAPIPPATPQPIPITVKMDVTPVSPSAEIPRPESASPAPVMATSSAAGEPTPGTTFVKAAAATPVSIKPAAVYTVARGDSLWKISDTVYPSAYFWPLIFTGNQVFLKHPDTLKIGLHLEIPLFEGRVGQLSDPEFQQLADGYFRVYQAYQHHRNPRAPYYLWVAYQLRAYWVAADELVPVEPDVLKFIRKLKGRGLIH